MHEAESGRTSRAGRLAWAVAARTHPEEVESGDAFVVRERGGAIVLAVIDGLGHGPEAHAASSAAVRALEEMPGVDVTAALAAVHEACVRTRGVAVSIAVLEERAGGLKLAWAGVGNVEGVLLRVGESGVQRRRLVSQNGVVGYRFPKARVSDHELFAGDVLVLATDGIAPDFADALAPLGDPHELASRILEAHGVARDDALVVVARVGREAA